jgi:cold shock CspA family protein
MNTRIAFRDIEPSAAAEEQVVRRAEKLQTFHHGIVGCHVVIDVPHRHRRNGKQFHVLIELALPGGELVVSRDPPENRARHDLHACIEAAFDDAERELEDWVRKRRGDVKTHARSTHGRVKRIFPQQRYGFLENESGDEVYFHEHAVLDENFDRLTVGDRVRYGEEPGEQGPQASFVDWTRHERHSASFPG